MAFVCARACDFLSPYSFASGNEMMLATSANRLPFTDGVKKFRVCDPLLCSGMLRHYERSGSGERKEKRGRKRLLIMLSDPPQA